MQTQKIVTGLLDFKMSDMQKVCEACKFGKESKHEFLKEKNVSGMPLGDPQEQHPSQVALIM